MAANVITLSSLEVHAAVNETHPDADLIARLRAGDDRAYHELYRTHAGDVFRLARRFVHSDTEAEEVLQDVFIAAYRNIERFRGQSKLGTWLYRITVNRALKRRRWWQRRRETGPASLEPMSVDSVAPDRLAGDRQALEIVRGCLEQVEARKRAVLILHELEGLDTGQIAEVLECPRSTVLTRLARARADLIRLAQRAGVSLESPGCREPDRRRERARIPRGGVDTSAAHDVEAQ